jgi:hypothetical protein
MDNFLKAINNNLNKAIQSNKHYKSTNNIGSGVILATHILKIKNDVDNILKSLSEKGIDINRIEVK